MSQTEMKPGEWLFRLFAFGVTMALYSVACSPIMVGLALGAASREEFGVLALLLLLGFFLMPMTAWIAIVLVPLIRHGQTVGLKLFGLRVVDMNGMPAGMGRIVLREGIQVVTVCLLVGIIGLLWALFDKDGRTLFDKITRTRVVEAFAKLRWVNEFREFRSEGYATPE